MILVVLSSLETVHDTVQYSYCVFSLLNCLLRIRLKHQNPLVSYVRQTESTLQMYNVVYSTLQMYNAVSSTLYYYFI